MDKKERWCGHVTCGASHKIDVWIAQQPRLCKYRAMRHNYRKDLDYDDRMVVLDTTKKNGEKRVTRTQTACARVDDVNAFCSVLAASQAGAF